MGAKKKSMDSEEIKKLDLVSNWLLSIPEEEILDSEVGETIRTCRETWGDGPAGRKQSILYIRTTYKTLLEKLYKEDREFFDENLAQTQKV